MLQKWGQGRGAKGSHPPFLATPPFVYAYSQCTGLKDRARVKARQAAAVDERDTIAVPGAVPYRNPAATVRREAGRRRVVARM